MEEFILNISTILSAVKSIPDGDNVIFYMDKLPLAILIHAYLIHAYYLHSDEFITPTSEQVLEVEFTHEHWLCINKNCFLSDNY